MAWLYDTVAGMPKRKDWSLTDRLLTQSRDSQDRQGRFSAPSPDRLRERAGRSGKETGDSQFYNRATYEQADISGSGRQPAYTPAARGGRGNYDDPTVPTRSMAGGHPRIDGGSDAVDSSKRRQASTQAAYRAADASMFNSTVTPKAERAENKKPRSRMSPDQNVFW